MVDIKDLDKDRLLHVSSTWYEFEVMTKEEFLVSDYYLDDETEGLTVYLAEKVIPEFDLYRVLQDISNEEGCYEDWAQDVYNDIKKSGLDPHEITNKIYKAFKDNPTYISGEEVVI